MSLGKRLLYRLPTERIHWEHGDTASSGGLWSQITPDTDDDRRLFFKINGVMRIFAPWGEIAYSKNWCKLNADEIAWRSEYRKTGNIFKKAL